MSNFYEWSTPYSEDLYIDAACYYHVVANNKGELNTRYYHDSYMKPFDLIRFLIKIQNQEKLYFNKKLMNKLIEELL